MTTERRRRIRARARRRRARRARRQVRGARAGAAAAIAVSRRSTSSRATSSNSIHQAALTVLQEIGIDFLHDEAHAILKSAGADVDPASNRVRFDPALVEAHIGLAPKEFTLHARNPARNLTIGGRHVAFCSVASAPNSFDREGGRRPGNKRDYQNFIRLGQSFNSIHFWGGYPVEPIDIHASVRHLDALFDMLTLSDKPIHAYSLGRERILRRHRDGEDRARHRRRDAGARALAVHDHQFVVAAAARHADAGGRHPDGAAQSGRRADALHARRRDGARSRSPARSRSSTPRRSPALSWPRSCGPGAPFVYGGFTSNVDMKSGAPAFGTPEYMKTAIVGGQLARRLALPYRSSNANAANSLDAQAAYESVFSLWGAIMGGVNFLMHGAGWMEGGLQASFEKMALDADLLAMVAEFLRPLRVDEAELALEAMREVGPGGHFFGAAHTQIALPQRLLPADDLRLAQLRELARGRLADRLRRGRAIVAERLRDFTPPPLEAERLEALPPSSPAARRKAARRPTFERDPADAAGSRRSHGARAGQVPEAAWRILFDGTRLLNRGPASMRTIDITYLN